LEREVLSLEDAVRSMTSLPARLLGLKDRGMIRESFAADLVVVDLERVGDRATFFEPHQTPEGMPYVLVNGEFAVDDGVLTGKLAGSLLSR
jgi:N-acyl-D-amino-acid deacylase